MSNSKSLKKAMIIINKFDDNSVYWASRMLHYLHPTSGNLYIMQSKLYLLIGNTEKAKASLVNHNLIMADKNLREFARKCRQDINRKNINGVKYTLMNEAVELFDEHYKRYKRIIIPDDNENTLIILRIIIYAMHIAKTLITIKSTVKEEEEDLCDSWNKLKNGKMIMQNLYHADPSSVDYDDIRAIESVMSNVRYWYGIKYKKSLVVYTTH